MMHIYFVLKIKLQKNGVTNLILEIYKDLGFENVILKYSDSSIEVGDDNVWDKLKMLY